MVDELFRFDGCLFLFPPLFLEGMPLLPEMVWFDTQQG